LSPEKLARILRKDGVNFEREVVINTNELNKVKWWNTVSEVLSAGGRFVPLNQYARKYNISKMWVSYLWRMGILRGVRLSRKVVLVEDIPYERPQDAFVDEDVILEKLMSSLRRRLTKPVALLRVSRRFLRRKGLQALARRNLLFRIGRFYYVLCDTMNRNIHEVKTIYPDPNEILVPKLHCKIRWDDVKQVSVDHVEKTHEVEDYAANP